MTKKTVWFSGTKTQDQNSVVFQVKITRDSYKSWSFFLLYMNLNSIFKGENHREDRVI